MTKSIMQPDGEKECYISGSQRDLDLHHVIAGTANRKLSDKYGLWVWLRHDIHMDLHDRNKELDKQLRQEGQKAFEEIYGHEKWMNVFGKSYL